jgi:GDP-mannose 6-dehydrogenase
LAFKPNTDDLRESAGVALIEMLIGKGCDVRIYDPHIQLESIYGSNQAFLLNSLPHIGRCMEKTLEAVLGWAEVMVITQPTAAETSHAIARRSIPVIDVTSGEGETLTKGAGG